jgi:hypothetical protein
MYVCFVCVSSWHFNSKKHNVLHGMNNIKVPGVTQVHKSVGLGMWEKRDECTSAESNHICKDSNCGLIQLPLWSSWSASETAGWGLALARWVVTHESFEIDGWELALVSWVISDSLGSDCPGLTLTRWVLTHESFELTAGRWLWSVE